MDWIKRNLSWVIAGAVALLLVAASGFYLYLGIRKERDANAQLSAQITEWNQLETSRPHPNDTNILAAKKDVERVAALQNEYRRFFTPFDYPKVESNLDLRQLMMATLADLRRQADEANVTVQTNYSFSFEGQRPLTQFEAATHPLWVHRLVEVRALCQVLFDAKVKSLESVQRASVSKDDGVQSDLIQMKDTTNALAVITPYQLSFVAFSSQLADVLNEFAASPHCFLIRSLNVSTNTTPAGEGEEVTQSADGTTTTVATQGSMMERMMRRYGARYRGMGGMTAPTTQVVQAPAQAKKGPETILAEVPLKAILQIDVIKVKPPPEPAAGGGLRASSGPR